MNQYINLDDQNRVVTGALNMTPLSRVRLKAGAATQIAFRFIRGGRVVSLGTPSFRFAAKVAGERDSDPILETLNAGFAVVDSDPADWHVIMDLNTATAALWDLFGVDEVSGNDVLLAELDAELLWTVAGVTQRTPAGYSWQMENPVIRDEDLPPPPTDPTYPDPTAILVADQLGTSVCPIVSGKVPAQYLVTPENPQAVIEYTLAASDAGMAVMLTEAVDIALTVPDDATAIPVGSVIEIDQGGAGKITVTGAAGVTVYCLAINLRTKGLGAVARLRKRGANSWILSGDLE